MSVVGWLVLTVAGCVAFVAWRSVSYPGGWAYAFGAAWSHERRSLGAARRAVWRLQLRARRELLTARTGASGARNRYEQRVRASEQRLEEVSAPGPGAFVEGLGELVLHRKVLRVGADEIPLAQLGIRAEHSQRRSRLHLTGPDGRKRQQVLSGAGYDQEAVKAFVAEVQRAMAAEKRGRKQHQRQIGKARANLEQVRADTAATEQADRRLAAVVERHRANPELAAAKEDLEAARKSWESHTGRRPY